jgi:hypothetical protein
MTTLTEDQWQSLLPWLKRIKPHLLKAAHAVLVKGKSVREAGEPDGLSRQHVHRTVGRVLDWQRRVRANISVKGESLPPGWLTVCFDLPKSKVPAARKFMESLRAEARSEQPKKKRLTKRRGPRHSK